MAVTNLNAVEKEPKIIPIIRDVTAGTQRFIEQPLLQALYEQLVEDMMRDIRPIPGFGTLHKMLCERAAFAYVMQRKDDFDADVSHINWDRYDTFYKNFMQATEELFREGRTLGGDLLFKRTFINDVMTIVRDSVADPDVLIKIADKMKVLGDTNNG